MQETDPLLEGDTGAACDFLAQWAPEGPWALTAIQPDKKKILGGTFETLDGARDFIGKHNGKMNLYFHVNPLLHKVEKKAERQDVREVAWLHVDIDPRAGENVLEEQARALALLTTSLPEHVPPPTVVVFSGGGYQGFWKLSLPIPINGDLAAAEEAKGYNQFLELAFGADHCHNIDRIMRIPGTINIPDAKKIKKGRTRALAQLVSFSPELVYPIEDFKKVSCPPSGTTGTIGKDDQVPLTKAAAIVTVDELDEWGVPDNIKIAIAQGSVPGESVGDNSRSAWLFHVCCQLLRRRVPKATIYAIITDPTFGISESVLEKRSTAERYALRQIARAGDEIEEPALRRLNDQFCVIGSIDGRCRVIEEIFDPLLDRTYMTTSSFEDFANRYCNQKVDVGNGKTMPLGKWWLNHTLRRYYDYMVFAPGKEIPGAYNLWRGFTVEPKDGDCSLYLQHLRANICDNNDVLYDYLLKWMANCVQFPGSPGHTALVFKGGQGVGKGVAAQGFGRLFGSHFIHLSQPEQLVGKFNEHMETAVFVFADEAYAPRDTRHVSVMKALITERQMSVEPKGRVTHQAGNCVHMLLASNAEHIVPAGEDERRFVVFAIPDHDAKQKGAYFERIEKQLEKGGRPALLKMLLEMDLSKFNVREVPFTEALQDQKLQSLDAEGNWWYEKLVNGRVYRTSSQWDAQIVKDELVDDYVKYTERWHHSRRGNATALGRFLSSALPHIKSYKSKDAHAWPGENGNGNGASTDYINMWNVGSLAEARRGWEKKFGKMTWPSDAIEIAADTQQPLETEAL